MAYVLNNRHILTAWEKLTDGRITTAEFVEQASNFVNNLVNNLGHAGRVADDLEDPELIEAVAEIPMRIEAVMADDPPVVPGKITIIIIINNIT